MSFPREARYIQDWSPASGLSYLSFLQNKQYGQNITVALRQDLLPLLASEDILHGIGYAEAGHQGVPGYRLLNRDITSLEQSIQLGSADPESALRWNMTQLAIGMPSMSEATDTGGGDSPAQATGLVAELYSKARSAYMLGDYREALDLSRKALKSQDINPMLPQDFRLSFLIGRLHIGSWLGPHKNASREIIDTEKAENAFLDAFRILKNSRGEHGTDIAHCMLWAARAAYAHGDLARAIGNTHIALGMLNPADGGLYIAASYQYAKFLCTRGDPEDYHHAEETLLEISRTSVPLLIEAASDPQFVARKGFIEGVIAGAIEHITDIYKRQHSELITLIHKLESFSYDGTSALKLLRDEISEMAHTRDAAMALARGEGLMDLAHATRITADVLPKPGQMFGLYRSRFNKECTKNWENMAVTHAAKSAEEHHKHCLEAYTKADAVYRQQGGYNRNGGQDKLGFAGIASLLTIYMFAAEGSIGPEAIVFALIFMIVASWFYWAYFRIRFGLVDGYDAWRKAKTDLEKAHTGLDRQASASSKAWKTFQSSIDGLGEMKIPF